MHRTQDLKVKTKAIPGIRLIRLDAHHSLKPQRFFSSLAGKAEVTEFSLPSTAWLNPWFSSAGLHLANGTTFAHTAFDFDARRKLSGHLHIETRNLGIATKTVHLKTSFKSQMDLDYDFKKKTGSVRNGTIDLKPLRITLQDNLPINWQAVLQTPRIRFRDLPPQYYFGRVMLRAPSAKPFMVWGIKSVFLRDIASSLLAMSGSTTGVFVLQRTPKGTEINIEHINNGSLTITGQVIADRQGTHGQIKVKAGPISKTIAIGP
ncbi:MAG: hypothetical protein IPJ88_07635 [Myxococcales bacterium]|nr:MAG: hypothetical protein IPJ88_07635 [Myxococcales bacterium]